MIALLLVTCFRPDSDVVDFNRQPQPKTLFQSAVQSKLSAFLSKNDIVGGSAVVIIDGKLGAAAAAGMRKFGGKSPLQVSDPMHIASNTKGMTSLIFGRMVEQGKLRFSDTIQGAVPYSVSVDFRDLPLIELMRQRSGIDDGSAPQLFDDKYNPVDNRQRYHGFEKLYSSERQLYARDCLATQAGYRPLSKFTYSNANFMVLGAIEEIASHGATWEDLMKKEVFGPLHMKSAGFGPMGTGADDRAPWQHLKEGKQWKPIYHDNPRYFGPAGSVHCSAIDLANFASTVAQGELGRGNYLRAETWQTLVTPPDGSTYACGFVVNANSVNGFRNIGHEGSNTMSTSCWLATDRGRIIVVVMLNCASDKIDEITLDLLKDARESLHL